MSSRVMNLLREYSPEMEIYSIEEAFLNLSTESFGLYIPADEILVRTKFQWFAVLPSEQILKSNMIVSKYLTTAIVNSSDEYYKKNEMRSVVAL
jgi:nucleotidyltransferase/DNA polymerase involved in DNA repair